MSQRSILLTAAGLTAFVLLVIGAAGALVLQAAAPPATPAPTAVVAATAPAADPVAAAYAARDAAYQAALQQAQTQLQEATRRLEQANSQLSAAYAAATVSAAQPLPPTAPPPTVVPPTPVPPLAAVPTAPPYPVTALQAAAIALAAAPGGNLLARPDLVDFQGSAAYEVRLDQGMIYVSATSGGILYNGVAATQAAPAAGAAPRTGGGEHEGREQDGGDD